jgi:hypothetical protein
VVTKFILPVAKFVFLVLTISGLALPGGAATRRKATKHLGHSVSSSSPSRRISKYKTPKYKGPKYPKYKAPKSQRRSYQQAPTPERYKDIQQALASKGYFHGEPNGDWRTDSADALKHFQAEQNLTPDGKLTSLSLIALGLGPKRLTAEAAKPDVPK